MPTKQLDQKVYANKQKKSSSLNFLRWIAMHVFVSLTYSHLHQGHQLKFPVEITSSYLRPDIVLWSAPAKVAPPAPSEVSHSGTGWLALKEEQGVRERGVLGKAAERVRGMSLLPFHHPEMFQDERSKTSVKGGQPCSQPIGTVGGTSGRNAEQVALYLYLKTEPGFLDQ